MTDLKIFCAGGDLGTNPIEQSENWLYPVPGGASTPREIESTKTCIKVLNVKSIIQDSGGFQLYIAELNKKVISFDPKLPVINDKNRINIHPVHLIKPAQMIRPDKMTCLDFPIGKVTDINEQQKEFLNKLGCNIYFTTETYRLHKKYGLKAKLFLSIQCYTIAQLDYFLSRITDVEYDGISMPVRNLNVAELAVFIMKYKQIGVHSLHLLGTMNFFHIALLSWLAFNGYFKWLSIDATTWRIAGEKMMYINPYNLRFTTLKDYTDIPENTMTDCDCPACEGNTFNDIKNMPERERRYLLFYHNFYAIKKHAADCYKHASDINKLCQFLKSKTHRKNDVVELAQCLKMITMMKDRPIEKWQNILTTK